MKRSAVSALALALAGCQTAGEAVSERYKPMVGLTITEYIERTGEEPSSSFDNERGERIWIVQWPGGGRTCRVITTVPEGKTFKVTRIAHFCV